MQLIVEKLEELISLGLSFDEITKQITEYQKSTGLLFMLQSLKNLANNGRVSHAVAKISGMLGMRIIGLASDEGRLDITDKSRGDKKALVSIIERLKTAGCKNGKIRISHCQNEEFALTLKAEIEKEFNTTDILICENGGLCSFYAESGGVLIGFEK
jgi:DegV family protein with EDD domain